MLKFDGDFPFIDFEDFDALGMDVVLDNDEYNLQIVFLKINEEKEFEEGMVIRTTIFEKNLVAIAYKIKAIFELGIFLNLEFLSNGHVLSNESDIIEEVDWNDYSLSFKHEKLNTQPEFPLVH